MQHRVELQGEKVIAYLPLVKSIENCLSLIEHIYASQPNKNFDNFYFKETEEKEYTFLVYVLTFLKRLAEEEVDYKGLYNLNDIKNYRARIQDVIEDLVASEAKVNIVDSNGRSFISLIINYYYISRQGYYIDKGFNDFCGEQLRIALNSNNKIDKNLLFLLYKKALSFKDQEFVTILEKEYGMISSKNKLILLASTVITMSIVGAGYCGLEYSNVIPHFIDNYVAKQAIENQILKAAIYAVSAGIIAGLLSFGLQVASQKVIADEMSYSYAGINAGIFAVTAIASFFVAEVLKETVSICKEYSIILNIAAAVTAAILGFAAVVVKDCIAERSN